MVCLRQIFRLFCENVCKVQFSLDNLVKSLQLFPLYYFQNTSPTNYRKLFVYVKYFAFSVKMYINALMAL